MLFQSLSGFQVRCNRSGLSITSRSSKPFQSLSGFQVRCNTTTLKSDVRAELFQSLSGFQVRCNVLLRVHDSACRDCVSIPIGFSSSLQRKMRNSDQCSGQRFNPYRVFKFAATYESGVLVVGVIDEFQSLSGFQVRCNFRS